ncbi:MAG: hypothetical protein M3R26_03925 [Actinomycetota bacterium]|nr:hypothetical protein [Actinomycetota bacterium]
MEGLERRELPLAELVEADRRAQVLEPVLAEVAEVERLVQQLAGGLREQHLSPVSSRGDPSGAVDVDPNVVLASYCRGPGMYSHPHAHLLVLRPGLFCQPALGLGGGSEGIVRTTESAEEGVALGVDLDAGVGLDRLSEDPVVALEQLHVRLAELVEQARRALDVGEKERDRAGWEVAHSVSVGRSSAKS